MFINSEAIEWAYEFPRQVGKTDAVADWLSFMLVVGAKLLQKPLKVIVFAPTKFQAGQDYRRFRSLLNLWAQHGEELDYVENTKDRVELKDGNSVSILPLSKQGDIVGASGNFLIFEEAQDLDDDTVENKAMPMGANYASPAVFIGTAGTRLCKFYTLILRNQSTRFSCWQIIDMRQQQYELDKNPAHLNYKKNIEHQKKNMSPDNFGRQFNNLWLLAENQFMLPQQFDAMCEPRSAKWWNDEELVVYSLDQARKYDGCVLTRLVYNYRLDIIEVDNPVQLPSGSYADHYDYLASYLSSKQYDIFIADVTGNQHVLTDMLSSRSVIDKHKLVQFHFSQQSKHDAFSLLDNYAKSSKLKFINADEETRFEFSILQKKYNHNGTIAVSTPSRKGYHDDRPCTVAMGVYAIHNAINQSIKSYSIA